MREAINDNKVVSFKEQRNIIKGYYSKEELCDKILKDDAIDKVLVLGYKNKFSDRFCLSSDGLTKQEALWLLENEKNDILNN